MSILQAVFWLSLGWETSMSVPEILTHYSHIVEEIGKDFKAMFSVPLNEILYSHKRNENQRVK